MQKMNKRSRSLFRFINRLLILCYVVSLVACSSTGAGSMSHRQQRVASSRAPVPISAAQESDFKKALSLMKKQAYAEAIPLLEAILLENNRLPGTHINLAIAYMKLPESNEQAEQFKKAEQALLKAIETNSREAVAHFQLGLLYRKMGRFEQARESYESALRIDNAYSIAHNNLAVLCDIYLQQAECAVEHFEAYIKLVPADAEKVGLWLSDIRRRAGIIEPTAAYSGAEQ